MAYPYEDLDDSQFERLVVQVMRKLFGPGVESFAAGPDGGRDARFRGTAERFPSAAGAWVGTTVGQAKHTNAINAHVSDSDFGSDADTSVISHEIVRIKSLARGNDLDNYFLVTNRRVGGVAGPRIIKRISDDAGVLHDRIHLAGIEFLDDMVHEYPDLLRLARIDPIDGPLLVSSREFAEVILGIADVLSAPSLLGDSAVMGRVSLNEKDLLNGMTPAFSRTLVRNYMGLVPQIQDFLASPANSDIRKRYEAAVEDFQLKIVAHRQEYQTFDHVYNYLIDLLFKRDGVLSANRRTTRAMLFYMYWHCDIGEVQDATAE
ncbi:ABC-three component system protein [Promicromonospora sp. NPDC023805]|uniref:ABC-three component system protein n=1 Tax=Promicromonospora sp. NPDC023805 TaxID=3154696 RepID=UPI0034069E99